ncbi:hypothetical protein BDSB_01465 [Burkholderia dolosa PC543]|nr:hypothetical protein BDSB_01465 [Burkholderia dolosa PC543]
MGLSLLKFCVEVDAHKFRAECLIDGWVIHECHADAASAGAAFCIDERRWPDKWEV